MKQKREVINRSKELQGEIMVSICCITYNHAQYIEEALNGFLMQKTKFKYEIIIHDDASTDNTADIIREYQRKYPDIIKPILQTENQYKTTKRILEFCFDKAKGKYIAICEGDDFWIDQNKLQKQVDYMEANESCSFCFHNAEVLYMKNNHREVMYTEMEEEYTAANIHYIRDTATASFFFRRRDIEKLPRWCLDSICSDIPLKLVLTSYGYAHYMDDVMSVYRKETGISVTDTWSTWGAAKRKYLCEKIIEIIDNFDKYTNFKYSQSLQESKLYYQNLILLK